MKAVFVTTVNEIENGGCVGKIVLPNFAHGFVAAQIDGVDSEISNRELFVVCVGGRIQAANAIFFQFK